MAAEQNFTKGRRTELVQSSCLYLTCRQKNFPVLLIDFSSYLRVSVWTSIDLQTGVKPSGICGAALYIAALCHGIKCPKTDIATIVHTCEATIVKRLVEFCHTESASLNVDELTERETLPRKRSSIVTPYSDKERVFCKHQADGLCLSCYERYQHYEHSEASDVLGSLSDADDSEPQAAKAVDDFPDYARNLVEASKAAVKKARKPVERSPKRSKTKTDMKGEEGSEYEDSAEIVE
ncbi:hypothetical protein Bca4012_008566 [Brassica carinata]